MYDLAVQHDPRPPYAYPLSDERIRVRLRTASSDPRRPVVEWSDRQNWSGPDHQAPMRWLCDTGTLRFWETDVTPFEGRARYAFRLDPAPGGSASSVEWLSETGLSATRPGAEWPDGYFHFPYLHRERLLSTPDWVRNAICYEIFPDRFAHGPGGSAGGARSPDPVSWQPEHFSTWGGNLAGILDRVPYIASLGANLLWLTPIFASPSNHKYDTSDYGRLDPSFGTEETFARLVGACRERGIGILLDGVFNHSGFEFAPWRDVVERGSASPYWGWFDVRGERANVKARNYRTFAHTGFMPRLMTANPEVQAYLIEHAVRWTRMGIAGWRLDVADEVDPSFWRAFRREVRAVAPESYFVGEIAYNASRWLEGDQFDGVMNYPLRRAMLQFFAAPHETTGAPPLDERLDGSGFLEALSRMRSWYPGWATTAMLNPLSTHDVPRFLTAVGEDERRWRLALICLLTLEGIPLLYYGDEVGLRGGYDPECRRPMIWDPARQNAEMLGMVRQMTRLRGELPALRASGMHPVATGHSHVVAYLRGTNGTEELGAASCPLGATALVVLNAGERHMTLDLDLAPDGVRDTPRWPAGGSGVDMLTGTRHAIDRDRLQVTVGPLDALVLVPESQLS